MSFGLFRVPDPVNEAVRTYAPDTPERASLKATYAELANKKFDLPLWIGGKAVRTGNISPIVCPHQRKAELGGFHQAGTREVGDAIAAAQAARGEWAAMPWDQRAAIFLRAAALLRGPFRDRLNAATMLNQSKTAHQAEIDAACELIDFFHFNVHYLTQLYGEQPISSPGTWNRVEYRPLDGFVFAVTPFNFTSIAGNLPTAPALCGNTVVWKPASTAVLSGSVIMELLQAAGLPPGVINFVPGSPAAIGEQVLAHRDLAGVHFTGSTPVFKQMWRSIGNNIDNYVSYPRLVGETGGKDFVFAHPSADVQSLAHNLLRGAFEYQGQKCSAASRAYIPDNLWPQVREILGDGIASIKVGDVSDFTNFMGAVIDARAYAKLREAIEEARSRQGGRVGEVIGGESDDKTGFFIRPTVIAGVEPEYRTMKEELFGPVLTIHIYPQARFEETLALCERGSEYALTGAIFAENRQAIVDATRTLRHAAGNFYINDKPTGAVVGQQPFGGSKASGTNDKAGSMLNLVRWISPRTIKETFAPLRDFRYPFMNAG
ncbi:L-glutamate gamma-semialdehyde dehydrogenase [Nannocystis sp. RBIL2]|uniref:L-glutamate gamma-semialdehyde dehydrogenase n=1 Tax=Nannocystis sp. RBIL2 TaxID=2996788 RepID=UPI002270B109|nr:L-glutamate gamma-semialdehyde dehydrogenase [Nannocystis sp. RBIL2]MCY1066047.1 L-glutamate gamma-semialdehyde dehydrogenase [Nannocystis sp. RBIL2]